MNRRRCGFTLDFLRLAFDELLQDDVNYTRYMAENFATFDYKTQEEVFTVIKSLTSVLSTTGMQLLEIISPSHLLTTLHGTSRPEPNAPVEITTVGYSPCHEYSKLSFFV
jgi:Sister chromatid cohesion C-terminus